jgi:hypothetical protein
MVESLQVLVGLRTRKASGWIFFNSKESGFYEQKFPEFQFFIRNYAPSLGNLHVGPSSRKLYVVQNPLAEAFRK